MTSAVKALDSFSIGRRPTHGNDGHFFNYLYIPFLPCSLKLTPMRAGGDPAHTCAARRRRA
ncbi:hypothetical protein AYM02_09115 [Coxiella burnetii]|uniref:Hypothetical cytosolic protein n=2 Tax=Coxiella burnetii TaxID=777 RepID=Q83CE3_COXBU|nr:DUF1658 domain-containing protein [Coxiella burnetii]NP_820172.1 hypothetical protein CBU_1177 [Coxiella burnetii RSA 493]ACI23156.1 hypothetical cytosolic protein [Coxiella burnetii Dugway 5J108-111]ACJ18225.1 hypothetical cytosolic protein [Coxiella burnetii CbuG_Q212]ACJ20244.1 hypothetical cytosolic protein [Coxiella burnetii CbuK_Q154]APQ67048.1 DUF1658 domain-containing protein [Coxiella burnetii 'MSU Goat Q177']ATN85894.1 hypothetical protein AYO29_05250 [Coxiella burnetii str. Schp